MLSPMPSTDSSAAPRSNLNSWWGAATAQALHHLGVRAVVISPGSRSTPLSYACAAHEKLDTRVILDERSAAFFALGMARAAHAPVALICTSGTALANYLPAVVEASESGVPLIVLSADRPAELRYRRAGQTIDQVKLFGSHVRFFAEAPLPEPDPGILGAWRDLLTQAIAFASGERMGPVHVNCPFREPLAPESSVDASLPEVPNEFFSCMVPEVSIQRLGHLPSTLPETGWIIAGPACPHDPRAYVRAVSKLSRFLGWPVLADALSPVRHHATEWDAPTAPLTTYDTFLRAENTRQQLQPEAILQLGDLPTSKVLRETLKRWQLPTWIIDPQAASLNAVAVPARPIACRVEELQIEENEASGSSALLEAASAIERRTRAALDAAINQCERLIEPQVARRLIDQLPPDTPIFIASSMPVRDAEYFWPFHDGANPVFFNRGANGIDGTLSSALGVAEATGKGTVLYTGDLALLHDTNGLLAASSACKVGLTIICINNQGGGIFEHLPIASGDRRIFEACFGTPQQVDFALWARAYGIQYRIIDDTDWIADAMSEVHRPGIRLLEVRTNRTHDAHWRKATFAALQDEGCGE